MEWSSDEFEILLKHHDITDSNLADLLRTRSIGAVGVVREFIHNYHRGSDDSGLSKMMKNRLQKGTWTCSRCLLSFPGK